MKVSFQPADCNLSPTGPREHAGHCERGAIDNEVNVAAPELRLGCEPPPLP